MLRQTRRRSQSALTATPPPEIALADCRGADPTIVARLRAIEIITTHDWMGLGKARFRIFGITTTQATLLDELVCNAMHDFHQSLTIVQKASHA